MKTFAEEEKNCDKSIKVKYPNIAPVSYGYHRLRDLILIKERVQQKSSEKQNSSSTLDYFSTDTTQVSSSKNSQVAKQEIDVKSSPISDNTTEQTRLNSRDSFIDGDRVIAMASGGAFIGGLTGQIPLAALGAVIGALFGLFVKPE